MPDGTRVPQIIPDFNNYIIDTNARLLAVNPVTTNPYWTDFNFTAGENTEWGTRLAAWIILYALYASPTTSTSIVKDQVKNFISDFTTFAQPLLNKIVASGAANVADEHIFHVVLHRAEPTHHTSPIAEFCFALLKSKGGGKFDIHCRSEVDATRSSLPVAGGANSVQYAYRALPASGGGGEFDPLAPFITQGTVTKSHFELDLGMPYKGQWLYIYFRWYNTHHPALAGAWSELYSMVIG